MRWHSRNLPTAKPTIFILSYIFPAPREAVPFVARREGAVDYGRRRDAFGHGSHRRAVCQGLHLLHRDAAPRVVAGAAAQALHRDVLGYHSAAVVARGRVARTDVDCARIAGRKGGGVAQPQVQARALLGAGQRPAGARDAWLVVERVDGVLRPKIPLRKGKTRRCSRHKRL